MHVIGQIERLGAKGFKEIVLCGICLGAYGIDLRPKVSLLGMLEKIERMPGDFRIRLSSLELYYVDPSLIAFMKRSTRLCRHLHIPLQSGSDRILGLMNRRYTSKGFIETLQAAKKALPDLGFTTDVMVGFPGETQREFNDTLSVLRATRPLRTHIFPYSPRPGTKAFSLRHNSTPGQIRERLEDLRAVALQCTKRFILSHVGSSQTVLAEGRGAGGYSGNYMKVHFSCTHIHTPGDLVPVRIGGYQEPDIATGECSPA